MKLTPVRLLLAGLLALSLAGPARAASLPAGAAPGVPAVGRLIVKLRSPAARPALARLEAAAGLAAGALQPVRTMLDGAQVLALLEAVPAAAARQMAARLAAQPGVAYAVPDYIRRPLVSPDDPLLSLQWHLTDPAGGIRAAAAWAVTAGVTDVVVAVIDTGLVPHPDLAADRVLPGYDFVSDLFMANDGDARDADPADPGDWVTAQETVTQPACFGYPSMNSSWHGTHVTGVIAAQGGNGQGVAGVAWGVRVLPVRALGKCGGADSDIADAMLWAAGLASGDPSVPDNPTPAQILNLSLGGGEQCAATVYQPVVDQLRAAGVLVIAAAGNDGGPVSAPANCEGVLAVAANNRAGDLSNFSSYGPEVALTAPGGESGQDYIYSLYNSGVTGPAGATYAGFTGTSAAAPQVAGAAALVKSFNPQLTGLQLAAILTTTTHPLAEGGRCLTDPALGGQCGWGILDAGAAVNAAAGVVQALSPAVAPPGSGDLILTVTGQHFLAGAQVLWAGSPLATSFVDAGVLTATVPAARLAAPGAAAVAVLNPGAGAASFTPAQFIIGTSFYLPAIQRGS